MPRLARIHRGRSRSSAFDSSDSETLTLEVCPFSGRPGLQPQSWINENDNFFNLTSYIFINLKSDRRWQ